MNLQALGSGRPLQNWWLRSSLQIPNIWLLQTGVHHAHALTHTLADTLVFVYTLTLTNIPLYTLAFIHSHTHTLEYLCQHTSHTVANMHILMHAHTHNHIYSHPYVWTLTHSCTYICLYVYALANIHTLGCMHAHNTLFLSLSLTHTHTHTHVHRISQELHPLALCSPQFWEEVDTHCTNYLIIY